MLNILSSISSERDEDILRLVMSGWSQADIATEFNVTQGTISKWLSRVRDKLRHAL